jgi:enoyl-CoA hydratase/carnithine racemase
MILTGEVVTAADAERIGLVNRVVPPGQAEAMASQLAQDIASKGPLAVREAKRLLDAAMDLPLGRGLEAETEASNRVFDSDDMVEGARAFLEKRPPQFHGR